MMEIVGLGVFAFVFGHLPRLVREFRLFYLTCAVVGGRCSQQQVSALRDVEARPWSGHSFCTAGWPNSQGDTCLNSGECRNEKIDSRSRHGKKKQE
jgi:hypothetical protein